MSVSLRLRNALFSHGNTKKSQGWWRRLWRAVRSKSVFVVFLFSSLFSQNDWLTTDWSPPPSPFPYCTAGTRVDGGLEEGGGRRFIQRFFAPLSITALIHLFFFISLSLSFLFLLDATYVRLFWPLATHLLSVLLTININRRKSLFFLGTIGWPALSLCDWLNLVWWWLSQEKWVKQSEQWKARWPIRVCWPVFLIEFFTKWEAAKL